MSKIDEAVEAMAFIQCKTCFGDGYIVEHDPCDPTGDTPLQLQCEDCHAEGKYTTLDEVRRLLTTIDTEARKEERESIRNKATTIRTDYDEGLEVVFLSDIDPLPTLNKKQS